MSRLKSIFSNLRALIADDFHNQWNDLRNKIEAGETRSQESLTQLAKRADTYETAIDSRLNEYQTAIDARIDAYQGAVDGRIEERINAMEKRLDDRLAAAEATLDTRFTALQKLADERADAYEGSVTERATQFEATTGSRLETFETATTSRASDYESALDARIDARLAQVEDSLEKSAAGLLKRVDEHYDARSLATDNRLDDRLARIERHIDTRFGTLEKRSDDRMETHERAVDGKLHQRSQDIVDRNDLMLQIFDQQLDKFRRQLRSLDATVIASTGNATSASENGVRSAAVAPQNDSEGRIEGGEPPTQLVSYRSLAGVGAQNLRKVGTAAPPLYHQILSWKKTAHEGLSDFAPDEKEIVDYVLSFVSDEKEIAYVKQHLRRFVSTIERVPGIENPDDRLLELGSLGHLAPAIRKFCGYSEVFCGDFWESDEKVRMQTLKQVNGPDSHTFELRNFNVEADKFPYPDSHFKTVLCLELIEHLQRDPLHMLWECNRVLVDGGYLLLTTPNIASARAIEGLLVGCTPYLFPQYNLKEVVDQHNREYAPYEIGVALAAAGFSVVALETEDVWMRSNPAVIELLKEIQISAELRGDNIFALARKVGAPIERYPAELYTD